MLKTRAEQVASALCDTHLLRGVRYHATLSLCRTDVSHFRYATSGAGICCFRCAMCGVLSSMCDSGTRQGQRS
eukprot:3612036-Rhodomonas_salina.2